MTFKKYHANWPLPEDIVAYSTSREGGISQGPYESLNFGLSTADDPESVLRNRDRLISELPSEPIWLSQIHGSNIHEIGCSDSTEADAITTTEKNQVCLIQTADCLPILICDPATPRVAAVHAGWRSLAAGIIPNVMAKFSDPKRCLVWFGPCISQRHYEVGPEFRQDFLTIHQDFEQAFAKGQADRWHADLKEIAKAYLRRYGVEAFYGGHHCTFEESDTFYSHRRNPTTGRFASLIYIIQN